MMSRRDMDVFSLKMVVWIAGRAVYRHSAHTCFLFYFLEEWNRTAPCNIVLFAADY
jgi:hypothetical protein